ncbi:MAG: DUF3488 domain-containing protein [Chloroflexi bacterium]|nr:DUF3488 domain-containing protein [Chloroflexota bacterium]
MGILKYALGSRSLAFGAISSSIAAVAIVSGDALLFVVGVAGLAAGTIYVWRTHYAVSRVRTAVLLLLLLVLLAYLGRDMLFSWTSDRILLARYLVYGLVVTSFDLRTRRNVLGTLVVAGLLFVLLSEVAFGLWFPVLMAVFMLLALAAATVGHAEEESASGVVVVGGGSRLAAGKVWVVFAFGFMLLAAGIFLLMPRFGFGGGLAQASWLPSRIDLTRGGPAGLPSRPSASVSAEILISSQGARAGSSRYVTLGYVGSAADAVVMHVRSPVASYWRGSVLDVYDGAGWLPSVSRMNLVNEGRGEMVFPDSDLTPLGRRWYSQTYYLMADQPNALFTGYNPGRVYLPQTAQISLERGIVYRAVSLLPRVTPGLLRRDTADVDDLAHLGLPPITDRTAALAESIVAGAPTDYDKAVRLEQFLLESYPYDLTVEPVPPGRDAVDFFLFEQQAGYCAQFATAMAVMARQVGLPARVAIGYLPGVYDPMTGAYAVRVGDAHAWVEIHFQNRGWIAFDPTPRSDVALGGGRSWASLGLLGLAGPGLSSAASSLGKSWLPGGFPTLGWGWLAVAGVALVIAGSLAALVVLRQKARASRDVRGYTALDGEHRRAVLATYRRMVRLLARKGLPPRRPAQTPVEYARLVAPRLDGGRETVEWLSQAASAAAYDPAPISPSVSTEASDKLTALRRTLAIRARSLAPVR